MMVPVADLRTDYTKAGLSEADADPNPFRQFAAWLQQALESQLREPTAMTLATATPDGRPSARVVLLKGHDERGFVFFTNYLSHKGRELADNPRAALNFYWAELERQVRIEGTIGFTTREESERYFASRPVESRLGAWVSEQSAVVSGREYLDRQMRLMRERFGDDPPCPPHWGGYRLAPEVIEFWQGRPSRLHDRLRYTKQVDGTWRRERLAP